MKNFHPIVLLAVGACPCIAQQPCDLTAVNVELASVTVRTQSNQVKLYARTWSSGVWRQYYLPQVAAQPALDGNVIASVASKSATSWSDTVEVKWFYTLSQQGVGTYSISSSHWLRSPYCEQFGWQWFTYNGADQETIERPVISRTVVPYWLGGDVSSNDYSSQTDLSVDPKGALGTPSWSIVSSGSFGTLSCTNCSAPIFTAIREGTGCGAYDVVIKTNIGGLDSDPFWIDIQSPYLLSYVRTDHYIPPQGGWQSEVFNRVFSGCNIQMTNVRANEVFTSWSRFNGSNWEAPIAATSFDNLVFDGATWSWLLRDILYEVPFTGRTPPVMNAGSNSFSEGALDLMTQHTQEFRVGSGYNGGPYGNPPVSGGPWAGNSSVAKGVLVQTNPHYHYLDHGSH